METFELDSEYIELCMLLKLCGPRVSGGQAKFLISEGDVQVDGQVELRKKCKIRAGQVVAYGPYTIRVNAAKN